MNYVYYISSVKTCGNMKRTLIERKVAWTFLPYVGWVVSDKFLIELGEKAGMHALRLKHIHPHCDDCRILFMPPASFQIGKHCELEIKRVKNINIKL